MWNIISNTWNISHTEFQIFSENGYDHLKLDLN